MRIKRYIFFFLAVLFISNVMKAQNIADTANVKIIGVVHTNDLVLLSYDKIKEIPGNLRVYPLRNGKCRTVQETQKHLYRRFLTVNQDDIKDVGMLTEDSIRNLIINKKAYLKFSLARYILNYVLASPQCDSSLKKRLQKSYDFISPYEGWYYQHIQPKYKEADSEPITMNDNYSYMTLNVSDFLIVETSYEQYMLCHPEYEFEGFALSHWLSIKDDGKTVRVAIPIL